LTSLQSRVVVYGGVTSLETLLAHALQTAPERTLQ
jgi:hypothetical protein